MSQDQDALADALRALPGVTAAAVQPDEHGGVDSLRLDLSPAVEGLDVAGAASRLVAQRLSAPVDAEQVHRPAADRSDTDLPPPPRAPRPVRPEIVRTDVVTTGLEVSATVVLSSQSRAATGDARGAATASGLQRAVSQATLRAVERLARDTARIELDQVVVSQTGTGRAVLVILTLASVRGIELLSGSAVVREDESRAVVGATLDALNRRLETLLA